MQQNSKGGATQHINVGNHLDQTMSHSATTTLAHYEEPDQYCSKVPANIATNFVPAEATRAIMDSYDATPAFKAQGCFDKKIAILQPTLPPPVDEFMHKHAFSPIPLCCWGKGFTSVFSNASAHRRHMRKDCWVIDTEAQCTQPECNVVVKRKEGVKKNALSIDECPSV
jgi:hypothetical protein